MRKTEKYCNGVRNTATERTKDQENEGCGQKRDGAGGGRGGGKNRAEAGRALGGGRETCAGRFSSATKFN